MTVFILFGQRKCDYEGQYAPEVLDVCDEFTRSENPQEYMDEELENRQAEMGSEFSVMKWLEFHIPTHVIDDRLFPKHAPTTIIPQ